MIREVDDRSLGVSLGLDQAFGEASSEERSRPGDDCGSGGADRCFARSARAFDEPFQQDRIAGRGEDACVFERKRFAVGAEGSRQAIAREFDRRGTTVRGPSIGHVGFNTFQY